MEQMIKSYGVTINDFNTPLAGDIYYGDECKSWIIFAHGSGSSHKSERNIKVAEHLAANGHGAFLFDLLSIEEENSIENRFNIDLLSKRLEKATEWLLNCEFYKAGTPIGYFGASTGAAAALVATASFSTTHNPIYCVVCRGGRTDLVDEKILSKVFAPTLLIAGADDLDIIQLNKYATQSLLNCRLTLIPHAGHLFLEPGKMDEVARMALLWFNNHVPGNTEINLEYS